MIKKSLWLLALGIFLAILLLSYIGVVHSAADIRYLYFGVIAGLSLGLAAIVLRLLIKSTTVFLVVAAIILLIILVFGFDIGFNQGQLFISEVFL